MPRIVHVANLWSLVGHPSPKREWSLRRKIAAVTEAGFDGITAALTREHRHLAEAAGLEHLVGFISTSEPDRFATMIREQKEGGAVQINVQMDDHDTPPALAVKHWLRFEREAEKIGGVVVSLEVHRDTCTETPEKTWEIADRYHRATGRLVRFNFDFSHLAVVKHLGPANYAARLLERPELLQFSEQCHFRPFNGHHCQVPVTHRGRLTPEAESYLQFVEVVMKLWKAAPQNADKTLFACPELGPYWAGGAGYNITGLPPAWNDAVVLRGELDACWRRV
ncbi:hypothetical protein ASA1KI_44310 [Opitutales bacterium ASA1]|uniref:xylose isomerase n=1 Tax=Congregicoccus parvus TaxID=3081749 RepID=UPI002B2BC340|nr:hypothetical protein ASA1KI_44310 [Opitutales bacterium ASA1]